METILRKPEKQDLVEKTIADTTFKLVKLGSDVLSKVSVTWFKYKKDKDSVRKIRDSLNQAYREARRLQARLK